MTRKAPYRIVVGYDYSSTADRALARAFELASREERGEVHVVTVVVQMGDYVAQGLGDVLAAPVIPLGEAYEALEARAGQRMSEWQAATGKTFSRLAVHVRSEVPALEIAQLAADLEADLVVVGTHGRRGVSRFLLGSVAEGVVRAAPCAVLVVRPGEHPKTPEIEPPCPDCLAVREATNGVEFWCSEHRTRHGQRHTYHYEGRSLAPANPPLVFR